MPLVVKERSRPKPWVDYRNRTSHQWLIPFLYSEWLADWAAFLLSKWTLLEVLEYAGNFSVLIAVIFYFAESGDRIKARHYQAWQVINTAQGKGGSGGRIEALGELNEDHVPLVGVDVSEAFLQGVNLERANLSRGDLQAADMRNARLKKANLESADLQFSNLRNADLHHTILQSANFSDADLNGADLTEADVMRAKFDRADLRGTDLSQLMHWQDIASIKGADIFGIQHPPDGFREWAIKNGAVEVESDDNWAKQMATTQP